LHRPTHSVTIFWKESITMKMQADVSFSWWNRFTSEIINVAVSEASCIRGA